MKRMLLACAVVLALGAVLLPAAAYADQGTAVVLIEVEKQLEGSAPTPAEEYDFVLVAVGGAPMPGEAVAKVVGEGTARFPEIIFTAPGTYRYVVREIAGTSEGCDYDDTVYDVTVQVTTDDEGDLSAALWASRRGEAGKADEIVFVNRYRNSEEEPPSPGASGLLPETGDSTLALVATLSILVSACVVFFVRRGRGE